MEKQDKTSLGEKIFTASFWIIALVHIVVFTGIGLATRKWQLLVVFLAGFVIVLAVIAGVKIYLARAKKKNREEA